MSMNLVIIAICSENIFEFVRCQAIIFITHAPVHINDFRGVRARYVKRTG